MVETTLYKEFLIFPVPTLKEHADNLLHITQQNSLKRGLLLRQSPWEVPRWEKVNNTLWIKKKKKIENCKSDSAERQLSPNLRTWVQSPEPTWKKKRISFHRLSCFFHTDPVAQGYRHTWTWHKQVFKITKQETQQNAFTKNKIRKHKQLL